MQGTEPAPGLEEFDLGYSMGQELATMREKYRVLCGVLDERGRRVWAAAEANSLLHGGVSLVANATGLSRSTIHAGLRELGRGRGHSLVAGRSRKARGGRKPLTLHNPDLLKALEKPVEPTTWGDPESPLRRIYSVLGTKPRDLCPGKT
jgi:hypothetical protein